jgi:hypothetical protein
MPRAADMLGYRTGSQFGAGQTVDRSVPMATPSGEFIPTPPTASQEAWQGALSNPSIADILYGAGEATASLLSSPLPYVAGMVGYGYGALTGKDPKETGAQFEQATTLQPKTALGQYYTEQVGDKLSALPPVISGIPAPRIGAGATRYAGQQYGMPMLEKSLTMYEQGKLTPGFTPISQLEAWHGTPHEIKGNFDLAKVGTGEGAQSYGHGMYFGGARGTGEQYRDTLGFVGAKDKTGEVYGKDGISFFFENALEKSGIPQSAAKSQAQLWADKFVKGETINNPIANQVIESKGLEPNKIGNLYKVDIPDAAIPMMLDYDNPIKNQPQLYEIVRQNIIDPDIRKTFERNAESGITGANVYKNYISGKTDAERSANAAKLGITGIRYLDAGSRTPGYTSLTPTQLNARIDSLQKDIASGLGDQDLMKRQLKRYQLEKNSYPELTSNYVVFQPETVKILEKNDKPIDIFSILYK